MCATGKLIEQHQQKLNAQNNNEKSHCDRNEKTEMRTTKLINRYKKRQHRIRESQTEVDNRVHPLHWATSLRPSPMGTDPINIFKMVQNGSGINFSNCKQDAVQSL